jgi:hypothetical protein
LKGVTPAPVKAAPNAAAGGGAAALLGRLAPLAAPLMLSGSTSGNVYQDADEAERARMREEAARAAARHNRRRESTGRAHLSTNDGGRASSLDSFLDGPLPGPQSSIDMAPAKQEVQLAAQEMTQALQIQGAAQVDTGGIDVAINKARTLLSLLQQAGSAASSAASARLDTSGLHADLA